MRTAPWHMVGEAIYHNNTDCDAGVAVVIAAREGSGGKRVCAACDKFNQAESAAAHHIAESEMGRCR